MYGLDLSNSSITDHILLYNGLAVFPARLTPFDLTMDLLAKNIQANIDSDVLVVSSKDLNMASGGISTANIDGVAIINGQYSVITHIVCDNINIIRQLLNVIVALATGKIYIKIDTTPSEEYANFIVKFGFIQPQYIENGTAVIMEYHPRINYLTTLNKLKRMTRSATLTDLSITVFIPYEVAKVLSNIVRFENETVGWLSITRYDDTDMAILGVNSDNFITGDQNSVFEVAEIKQFGFHTHPDTIVHLYETFIAWPSSQDLSVITSAHMSSRGQIAHFVISPEGVWSVSLTIPFQHVIADIRSNEMGICATNLINAIGNVLLKYDNARSSSLIDPLDRYKSGIKYIDDINNISFADVINQHDCELINKYKNVKLFNVMFISWKQFDTSERGVMLTYDYVRHDRAGLTPHIEPYL